MRRVSAVTANKISREENVASSSAAVSQLTGQHTGGAPKSVRIPCLYTKQIQKKRKAWSDGLLRVSIHNGVYSCTLIDAEDMRGLGIESRPLEALEIAKFKKRQPFILTMESHLVDLTFESHQPDSDDSSGAKLKLTKFVPPSRIARPVTPEPARHVNASAPQRQTLDDELDDLWGLPSGSSSSHAHAQPAPRSFSTFRTEEQHAKHAPSSSSRETPRPHPVPAAAPPKGRTAAMAKVIHSSKPAANNEDFCDWIDDDSFYNIERSAAPSKTAARAAPRTADLSDEIDDSIWN